MGTLIHLGPLRPEHLEPRPGLRGTTPYTNAGVTRGYR